MLMNRTIETLKPRCRRYEISEPDGLRIRVYPSGRKAYLWRYRDLGGTQCVLTLGEPHVKLTEARRRLAEALRETGTDPAEAAAEKRETCRDTFQAKCLAPTVADILDAYMTRHVTQHCRPATVTEFGRLIAINLNPACARLTTPCTIYAAPLQRSWARQASAAL